MATDEDDEDFVYYGTPIEREEETSTRKRKAAADAGQLRALPVWKQEVRDEEGRKRFHGAFTGGFSAGYYNTVGSKEGWAPQTFTSSRKNRAEVKKQSIYNFCDDEDIKDMGGHALETSEQFDTFGFTAAEVARKQAEKEQQKRPSAIPGPVPDEIVLPATYSIGVKLLSKMGWRHGHSIKETNTDSLYDARRKARKAFLAFSGNAEGSEFDESESKESDSEVLNEKSNKVIYDSQNIPVNVVNPKHDLYGLGYDPFKHAPEFRDRKRLLESAYQQPSNRSNVSMRSNLASKSGKFAPGFGIGALEELDVEDEDIYASGFNFELTEVEEDEPSNIVKDVRRSNIIKDVKGERDQRNGGLLSGFKLASNTDYTLERFHPPVIPPDFVPIHKFPFPLETENKFVEPPPPEVPPPEENNLRLLIEGFATLVARSGKLFEDLSREKNKTNPLFSFLSGGNGHSYYARKLWEETKRQVDQQKQADVKSLTFVEKMTAESRGRMLGERPLERSYNESGPTVTYKEVVHLQSNLSDTFVKPSSLIGLSESVKPFKNDPAKQERFEQFLKDKYQGGLRSKHSGATGNMSEAERARERLDFEAAADAIEKGEWNTKTNSLSAPGIGESPFISAAELEKLQIRQDKEKILSTICPKREEFQWRPSPILCKRFDIIDPFMGKPPPLPRARSKLDTLIFLPDIQSLKDEKTDSSLPISQPKYQEIEKQQSANMPNIEPTVTNVERPVDLYKAIFSDDSDEENDNTSLNQVDESEKKAEGANTTLNRLVAGDFLESLGKELGFEVPPDSPYPMYKTNSSNASIGGFKNSTMDKFTPTIQTSKIPLENTVKLAKLSSLEHGEGSAYPSTIPEVGNKEVTPVCGHGPNLTNHSSGNLSRSPCSEEVGIPAQKTEHRANKHRTHFREQRSSKSSDTDSSSDTKEAKGKGYRGSKHRTHFRRHRSRSRSPDTDSSSDMKEAKGKAENRAGKHRTHSRHHRNSSRSPNSDSSSDHGYRDRSRSRDKTRLSEGKSKKHSKHHKDKRNKSPSRYSRRESNKDLIYDKRKDEKYRDRS